MKASIFNKLSQEKRERALEGHSLTNVVSRLPTAYVAKLVVVTDDGMEMDFGMDLTAGQMRKIIEAKKT